MKQTHYFVTATLCTQNNNETKRIYISTEDIKQAFEVERELLNSKTMEIYNIRHTKYRPKHIKRYIKIQSIHQLDDTEK